MASVPCKSTYLELCEPDSTKPHPLRIVKRSQTISNCSAYGKIRSGGFKSSNSLSQRKWSPQTGFIWPVTVKKKRFGTTHGRLSIFESLSSTDSDAKFSSLEDMKTDSSELTSIGDDCKDMHPTMSLRDSNIISNKTNDVQRTVNSEFYLEPDLQPPDFQGDIRQFSNRDDGDFFQEGHSSNHRNISNPRASKRGIYDRSFSKSGKAFLNSLTRRDKRGHKFYHSGNPGQTDIFKQTKTNGIPRSRKSNMILSEPIPHSQIMYSSETQEDFSKDEFDTAEIYTGKRAPHLMKRLVPRSFSTASMATSTRSKSVYILCPEIAITPEVSSVDISDSSLWVAVEVKGILKKVNGDKQTGYKKEKNRESESFKSQDLEKYGRLESMQVDIEAGSGCFVSDIIKSNCGLLSIKANETHLFLVRLRFNVAAAQTYSKNVSLDGLISELQNDLGESWSQYLSVRLSYRHSGFDVTRFPPINTTGINSHITKLQTEATALIKGYNSKSAWLPSNFQPHNLPISENPILRLVEKNLSPREARDVMRRIAESKAQILPARCFAKSDVPIEPVRYPTFPMTLDSYSEASPLSRSSSLEIEFTDEVDPALKIWAKLRADSCVNQLENSSNASLPLISDLETPRLSSSYALNYTVPTELQNNEIEADKHKIMEIALQDKIILDVDTLRNIATSTFEENSLREMDKSRSEKYWTTAISSGHEN
ncbi:putative ubiquitin-conjugating enzyme protein [Golovinomyces cichoracearum]|uniref:Putative ubiquitin-conjugating enzyme protein n=1 Tax=Golovinomyces cichoracearum TaxID=62708 RepID=A0A420IVV9_9PEZI|nr:putative ubiquitin-conjugating enzyme protein [Golovinomyces cichoracearum]